MIYTKYHGDNGDSQLLVLIRPGTGTTIAQGNWELEIESALVRSNGTIDAWVERNNARPLSFISHQSDDTTLSIPGTARTVITVGATNSTFPTQLDANSSYGPTRDGREKKT
jgi:hypothetical protein